jgi:hypothetical protein
VSGLCGLDRDTRGLEITYLTHHDDVRILPQECLQGLGERQADLVVDVDLVDSLEIYFRRVFRGRDIGFRYVQNIQPGIKRDGLTGPVTRIMP